MSKTKAAWTVVAVIAVASTVAATEPVGFETRAGLVFSSGYKDVVDATYNEVSGGLGWLQLGVGVRVPVAPGWSVVPGADLLFNVVSGGVDDGINTIILPSVNAKYEFTPGAGFYVAAGLNKGMINMGTNALDGIESDGIGFQAAVGYEMAASNFFELGIVKIPVKGSLYRYGGGGLAWDEDFGGIAIRGGRAF